MDSFEWDAQYETGLQTVDHQHRGLVDLINRLAGTYTEQDRETADVDAVFAQLAAYAQEHFSDEEHMMIHAKLDPRHVDHHRGVHRHFLRDVATLRAEVSPGDDEGMERLVSFLVHWLGYHILGADQSMARQVAQIEAGLSPAAAYDAEQADKNSSTKPLVRALDNLFNILSERNQQLVELTETLEAKVVVRTAALRDANQRLEGLSMTDALTELPNRRHAMQRLEALWDESTASQSPLVVLMIDADHFKQVNDTQGHDAGDEVLRVLARTLKESLRTDDIVCRLGGDEFIAICPNTDVVGGLHVAEQTRAKVAALRVEVGEGAWLGSISVGVAARSPDMEASKELLKAADEGVYKAKQAGKNCVRTHEG